ncbi:MAG: methionyl-tRNA formyltransferase [Pelagibacteraceae bacterium TMED65]|nr:methionyl-tRNA formyltransferase [Rickettsiales bacterium]OUU51796.1 MAG: methionyl-tRNA formyltransferase [Pelagibacteraceae bacterium TMED65]|tara:strand:+ start:1956 stop:2906 length:951 start_codon:yes stop_codon:yes gene_type:complete
MKNLHDVKVGFYGTPEFSLKFLEDLYKNGVQISFVVSQPPRKSGRGKKEKLSPVHQWAKNNKIKVYTPSNSNDQKFLEEVSKHDVDINVVVAYGNILTRTLINLPKKLSINVHASLLPRWRGAAPVQRAILSDDKITGVCIMKVDEKLDAGPIIMKKSFEITSNDNLEAIYNKMLLHGKKLLKNTIIDILNENISYTFQCEDKATYAKKLNKEEFKIIWSDEANLINLKIRAFSPYPGAWTTFKNSISRVKILKASLIQEDEIIKKHYQVGDITEDFQVKCGKDFLKIEILQKEGKKPMNVKEFLNGNKIQLFSFS